MKLKDINKTTGQHSGLSSEFYILAILHRYNIDAHLTLGNNKAVDIIIRKNHRIVTIDVKSLQSNTVWLFGNKKPISNNNHYYVLVTYLNKMRDLKKIPEVYVLKSSILNKIIKKSKKGWILPYNLIKENKKYYYHFDIFL
jgi:hypothetical protein